VRFLADESCDFAVVRALRAAGHDVLAVAEVDPRSDDDNVLALATRENRVLLTEDKISVSSSMPTNNHPAALFLPGSPRTLAALFQRLF